MNCFCLMLSQSCISDAINVLLIISMREDDEIR